MNSLALEELELDRKSSIVASRVPPHLAQSIEREAAKQLISPSAWMRRALARAIQDKEHS